MQWFINGLKMLCQLVPANTLEKHENSRKLDKGRKIFLHTNYQVAQIILFICIFRVLCVYIEERPIMVLFSSLLFFALKVACQG
jgi:hypothetical protein